MDNNMYPYWLASVSGFGSRKIEKMRKVCESAEEIYHMPKKQLELIYGLNEKDVESLLCSRRLWNLEEEWEKFCQTGILFTSLENVNYPKKLREIADRPYGIFWKGRLPEEEKKTVAIVGARMCSEYGRAVAIKLGEALACCGVQVISGMAAGIDSFGHWGAIRGGGDTFAVLGSGVDVCYPKGALQLYDKICLNGGIISEYRPGTKPGPGLFPQRNRIISACADAVVLVEARERSGSLITADFALEQGKDIYAVPGRIDDVLSAGCNGLIAQGAGLILSPGQLLLNLNLKPESENGFCKKSQNALEKEETLVYSCFDLHTKNMEELLVATGMEISRLADILVRLQKKGFIVELFKNQYRKK